MSEIIISPEFIGQCKVNYPLGHLTWFKVGGPAEILFKPKSEIDLANFIQQHQNILPNVLGAGSNVIIRDGGIKGVVVKLGQGFNDIIYNQELKTIIAGASCLNINLANFCLNNSITGFEFLSGIPGTVGGGIAMNAGAYGREYKDIVKSVFAIDYKGKQVQLSCSDLKFKYRGNDLSKDMIFVKAEFNVEIGNQQDIRSKMQEIAQNRQRTQPILERTGGSVFANPTGYKAWELIHNAGLRGYSIGDAAMSMMHSNFMINKGKATSKELETLGAYVQEKVLETSNIQLHWEIKRLGYYD